MFSQTPKLQPIVPSYHIRILSDEQLEQIKSATFEILEMTGIHCPSKSAQKLYAEHGAKVDFENQIVKIPSEVVLEAMSHSPRFYTMGARSADHHLNLDGTTMYEGTDGTGIETIDFITRERRPSVKDDVAKTARVADHLASIGFYWPMVSAQDYPATAPLHELDASFNNTVKHVQTATVIGKAMGRYAAEMAKVVAGNQETMRKRPPLSLLVCTIAPLGQDIGGMESALVFAEAGLPVGFMAMPNTGSTAPATIAGTIAVGDAEIVASMVLIQMAFPGTPTYYSFMPGMTHPRTGGYYGHSAYVYAIGVELAHMWGVPTLAGTFGTDAPMLSWEANMGAGIPSLLCALCGAETGNGMGLLKGSTVLCPEALVLNSEIYYLARDDAAGLDTSQGSLALDVIETVGPRGHFLGERHTRDHMRKLDYSEVVFIPKEGGDYRDPIEVAREKVQWILENHHPEPLEEAKQAELKRILQAAERELG